MSYCNEHETSYSEVTGCHFCALAKRVASLAKTLDSLAADTDERLRRVESRAPLPASEERERMLRDVGDEALEQAIRERDEARAHLATLEAERCDCRFNAGGLILSECGAHLAVRRALVAVRSDVERLTKDRDTQKWAHEVCHANADKYRSERDALQLSGEALAAERDAARAEVERLTAAMARAQERGEASICGWRIRWRSGCDTYPTREAADAARRALTRPDDWIAVPVVRRKVKR